MVALFSRFVTERVKSLIMIMLGLFLFCWGIAVIAQPLMHMSAFQKIFTQMPKGMLGFFGGNDVKSLFTMEGFFSIEYFGLWMLCMLGGYVITVASSIVGREIERGTAEPMLALPLSRSRFFLARSAGLVALIAIVLGCNTVLFIFLDKSLDLGLKLRGVAYVTIAAFGLFLFIGAATLLISLFVRERSRVISLAATMLGIDFLGTSFSSMDKSYQWMGKLTVYHLYRPLEAISGQATSGLWLPAVFAAVLFAIAWFVFSRKDIAV